MPLGLTGVGGPCSPLARWPVSAARSVEAAGLALDRHVRVSRVA